MSGFKFTEKPEGENLHLDFIGSIDEDAEFPNVDSSVKKVHINLQDIKTINSVGIREWLDWIRPLSERTEITMANAPKAMVFQFNMVEGFLPPKAQVTSFYVPFYCENCDKEANLLFTMGKEVKVEGGKLVLSYDIKTASGCTAPDCNMEMDATEGKYFQFVLKR